MRGPNATYIPPVRVGLALSPWGFTLGLWGFSLSPQGFSETNMLVSGTRKARVGGITHRKDPCEGVCVAVKYRPKAYIPLQHKTPRVAVLCWSRPPTQRFHITYTNMLVSKKKRDPT